MNNKVNELFIKDLLLYYAILTISEAIMQER